MHLSRTTPIIDREPQMAELAVNGGPILREGRSFPSWPVHGEEEKVAVNSVLDSGKWWHGEKVAEFENAYAEYHDARYGVSCTSGTVALRLALLAGGIGAGDEVIVPPYTFMATASAVLEVNAIPVFADVELDTFNLSPEAVEQAITPRTRAIIPVHFAGLPADMDALWAIARKHDLFVIEDAAHAWGSEWKGTKLGAQGNVGCFSFQMSKNITAGEGGIALSNDEDLADKVRSFSNCGRRKDGEWYAHYIMGGNYRLTEIQAAILLCQLSRLDDHVEIRERNGQLLDAQLGDIPGIKALRRDERVNRRSWHLYCCRYDSEELEGVPRRRFLEAVSAEGIPFGPGYPKPLYKHPLFEHMGEGPEYCPVSCPYHEGKVDYSQVSCPNVEEVCETAMWLTQSVLLGTDEDMQDIVGAVKKVVANIHELKQ